MAIIRELLIRLGFQTDKRAINQTNNAITGFRTRFAFVAAAATYAFSGIATFFNDIAKATLDSEDLAKSLGLSLKELTQLQGAAQKVGRLDFTQTAQALSKVQNLLRTFRAGTSDELARIATAFKFQIDVNAGPEKLFKQILEGLGNISNTAERINIAERIFGNGLGARLADLSGNLKEFEKAIPDFEQLGKDAENSIPSFKKYQESINGLTEAWTNLTLKLSQTLVPLLTHTANVLGGLSDLYLGMFTLNWDTVKKGAQGVSKALDPLFKATGLNNIPEAIGKIAKSDRLQDLGYNLDKYASQPEGWLTPAQLRERNSNQINMNTEFNINVPAGTPEESVTYVSEEIDRRFRVAIDKMLHNMQSNNPVVE